MYYMDLFISAGFFSLGNVQKYNFVSSCLLVCCSFSVFHSLLNIQTCIVLVVHMYPCISPHDVECWKTGLFNTKCSPCEPWINRSMGLFYGTSKHDRDVLLFTIQRYSPSSERLLDSITQLFWSHLEVQVWHPSWHPSTSIHI